jgi:hypothetical protein
MLCGCEKPSKVLASVKAEESVIEQILDIPTKDGAMETFVCHPERGGPYPPILFLMDAPGIREELYNMTRRLASVGYFVMLPNLYYRAGKDTKYGPDVLTKGSADHTRMRAVRTKMTIPPVMDDLAAMIAWADGQKASMKGPVGTHGYCMSGPYSPGGCGALPGSHCGGGIVLRYVAGKRRGRKSASDFGEGQGRTVHLLRRARRAGAARDGQGTESAVRQVGQWR